MQTNIEPSHSVCYLRASLQLEVFDSFFLRIHMLNSQAGPSTAGSSRAISQSSVMNSVVSLPWSQGSICFMMYFRKWLVLMDGKKSALFIYFSH